MAKQLPTSEFPPPECSDPEALYQAERGRVDSRWFPLPSSHVPATEAWLAWLEQEVYAEG